MTQAERRMYLIKALLAEQPKYRELSVPEHPAEQKRLLRSLMNVRVPNPIGRDFLAVQDDYLQEETARKGITDISDLTPVSEGIYLWQGDMTTLRCDAIVNAANSAMTGCYVPCHGCIDNCIHTYAGIQLRQECAAIMGRQKREEEPGTAKITGAYNLPCKYVLHTVGPNVSGTPTRRDEQLLASCYRSCLELAADNGLESVAFCCISTGEFHFPHQEAAEIAVNTVTGFLQTPSSIQKVIFNVFRDTDKQIYRGLLGSNTAVETAH